MAKKEAIQNPTPEHIKQWKGEHDEVFKLKVGDKVGYLHDPDMNTVSLALSRLAKSDPLGSARAILENCWLGGDEVIKTKPKYVVNVMAQVNSIVENIESDMEKL